MLVMNNLSCEVHPNGDSLSVELESECRVVEVGWKEALIKAASVPVGLLVNKEACAGGKWNCGDGLIGEFKSWLQEPLHQRHAVLKFTLWSSHQRNKAGVLLPARPERHHRSGGYCCVVVNE